MVVGAERPISVAMSEQLTDLIERDGPQMPPGRGYKMRGRGAVTVPIDRQALWQIIMDPERLAAAIPGAETLHQTADDPRTYSADVGIGVGRLKGTYVVTAAFCEVREPEQIVLLGGAKGPFGRSNGEGWVRFADAPDGTTVEYTYALLIQGAVAVAGGRLLEAAADMLISKFFTRLARAVGGEPPQERSSTRAG